jgi:hypothetical protein
MKNAVFWDVAPCGSVRTDVSGERIASIIKVTIIGEVETTSAVTSKKHVAKKYTFLFFPLSSQLASVASYC